MEIAADELARRFGAQIVGNGKTLITGAQAISKASAQDVTFAVDEQNLKSLKNCTPAAVIIHSKYLDQVQATYPERTWLVVSDPLGTFIAILQEFRPQRPKHVVGISPFASIAVSAVVGEGCHIHPGVFIGENVKIGNGCEIHPGAVVSADCIVGERCTIYPNAVLYPQVSLGDDVIVHACAVLGADGFGYRFREGRFVKIPQLGSVQIHDDVEIGACTTIDRGMIGATVIGEGTKLDNLVQIGHNCELGKHNAFASQVGLAGSVTTDDYVRCAGQVGVADHVHLGANCLLGAKAGVHKDMEGGRNYLGSPATEEHEQFRMLMALRKLPDVLKQLRQLERQVEELKQKSSEVSGQRDAA